MKRKQLGFSLIELLIVVAIILIVAAIAIPSLISSRMAANESSAVESMRAINTAEAAYSIQFAQGYSTQLSYLGGTGTTATSTNALMLDDVVASGTKGGYTFSYATTGNDANGNPASYTLNGNPSIPGTTGRRYFFSDQSLVIRANPTTQASASDPAI